jgi:membrane protein required for colicin V production
LLGAAFGLARGVLVLLVLATIVAYTPADASPAWRESQGAAWLNSIVREWVPSLAPARNEPGSRSV